MAPVLRRPAVAVSRRKPASAGKTPMLGSAKAVLRKPAASSKVGRNRPLKKPSVSKRVAKKMASSSEEDFTIWPVWGAESKIPGQTRPGRLEVTLEWAASGDTTSVLVPETDCTLEELWEAVEKSTSVPKHEQLLSFRLDGPEVRELVASPNAPLPGIVAGASLMLVRFDSKAAWSVLDGAWIGEHKGCYGDGPDLEFKLQFESGGRFTGTGTAFDFDENFSDLDAHEVAIAGCPVGGLALKPTSGLELKFEGIYQGALKSIPQGLRMFKRQENTYCGEATLTLDESRAHLYGVSFDCVGRGRKARFHWLASPLAFNEASHILEEESHGIALSDDFYMCKTDIGPALRAEIQRGSLCRVTSDKAAFLAACRSAELFHVDFRAEKDGQRMKVLGEVVMVQARISGAVRVTTGSCVRGVWLPLDALGMPDEELADEWG